MQRRYFLKSLGLASAFAAIPAAWSKTFSSGKYYETKRTGKVHSKGKGIAGVVVTDGKHVVLTDKNGEYVLPFNDAAEFVYISLPSGYSIPNDKGIANFYRSLKGNAGSNDFALEKLKIDDKKHCFVVWADTQMMTEVDAAQLKKESAPDLKALVQAYAPGTLFHGIGCGDLVWDRFELYEDYKEAIGMTGVPFFNVIGNHDMNLDATTDDFSAKTFKKQFGPTYYSFNRGDIHYVVLDDVFYLSTVKKYMGYINENQLSWLEKDLSYVKPGTTVVVSLHIPTYTGAARRAGMNEERGGIVVNRKKLYNLLAAYNVHIMSGHTHYNEKWEDGNIMEHNHGTVCGAWWTGPICSDGTPSGYGVYEVDGSDLRWYYKSTGKPKEHQLRIYNRGKSNDRDEIAVNVWNWDTKWKVEWWEDDLHKGLMEQRTGKDLWAIEIYAGATLPAKHKFVEPTLADHLFFAKPSSLAKKISVKATDRFGNVFTEEITLSAKAMS